MELWLVRHAATEWSVAFKHTGRTDIPLTDAGREQAGPLREVLVGHEFALALCSPLGRARETAAIAGFADRVQLRDDLLEVDYGENEGRTTEEIRQGLPGWTMWTDGNAGGESPEDVGGRCDRVIAEALEAGGDVVCFAHGHVLRILAARWLGQPGAFGGSLALSTGAHCVLGFERERRAIWRWNAT